MHLIRTIVLLPRVRMLIAGGLSTGIAYASFLFFNSLSIHYTLASTLSLFCYLACNFLMNRLWSFESTADWRPEMRKLVSLHGTNQLVILIGLTGLVELQIATEEVAQFCMQTIIAGSNFILVPMIFGHRK